MVRSVALFRKLSCVWRWDVLDVLAMVLLFSVLFKNTLGLVSLEESPTSRSIVFVKGLSTSIWISLSSHWIDWCMVALSAFGVAIVDLGLIMEKVVHVWRVTIDEVSTVIHDCTFSFFIFRDVFLLRMFAVTSSEFESSERSKSVLSGTPLLSTSIPMLFHLSEIAW